MSDNRMLLLVPEEYLLVLGLIAVIKFHFFFIGAFVVGPSRFKFFPKEFMEKNFKTEHEEAFPGEPLPLNGYPDMGNGRYAEKLSYKEWY